MHKWILIALCVGMTSCASMPVPPPALENRSLRISQTIAGFEYQYEVCVKPGILGRCREIKLVKDTYDLTDPAVRQHLIDKDFVAKVREKILP